MKRIAIIGGGISGLSCGQLLKDYGAVTVFEREPKVGGLIRCERINGSLFHICGGHVFNTQDRAVAEWFWSKFDKEQDFVKADRRSAVCMEDGSFVDYPIENHVYQLDAKIQHGFIEDLKSLICNPPPEPKNFDEFLLQRFGRTLYELYFHPYNAKIWRRDLSQVPISWLKGKLPMPTVEEMLFANMNHIEEKQFVHSTFYYEKQGGSQFIADTLARDLIIETNSDIIDLRKKGNVWLVNGCPFDLVVFCGNIKELQFIIKGVDIGGYTNEIEKLESHGTTAVFCETNPTPYSWFYQPSEQHQSHRFICTGNFSHTNNAPGKMTCTVEFTDLISKDEIIRQLRKMPYNPQYVTHHYSPMTYPIQSQSTRGMIQSIKKDLASQNLFLCGRFAEWEYYNMDAAIASAMATREQLHRTGML